MKITVSAVASKEVKTKFGMKPTYSIKDADGVWYQAGFKNPDVKKGDSLEIEFESTKWGNKIITFSGGTGEETPVTAAKPTYGYRGKFPIEATDGQRSIIRQNSLLHATALVSAFSNGETDVDVVVKEVIRVAKIFEQYSAGDLERMMAEKAKE